MNPRVEIKPWDVVTAPDGTWALVQSVDYYAWSRDLRCVVWAPASQETATYGDWQLVKQDGGGEAAGVIEAYRRWRRY